MARWDRNQPQSIPDWFWQAVETPALEHTVEVDECEVTYREWEIDDTGSSCILFLHGLFAHARWWDFIAPQVSACSRVLAMDFTGMGDSDHRYEYTSATYAHEILAVADAACLDEATILVGHSLGGRMATKAINAWPDRFGGLVLVDSGVHDPEEPERNLEDSMPRAGRPKLYPSREVAESRFRLFPAQPVANHYLLHYIARNSVERVEGDAFTWKFDSDLPLALTDIEASTADYKNLSLPVSIIYGAESESYTQATHEYTVSLIPDPLRSVSIADARHHVFLDQPERFVDELQLSLQWIKEQTSNN
ncbi:MAG: alpha/beta hydrolase [Gammaproteobacteria bacterium]|nr:alpha/beta hydrolase [Gammaproteobacteria bacterium]